MNYGRTVLVRPFFFFIFLLTITMKHEILFLNDRRSYVRLGDVWYDTHREHYTKVGDKFLNGIVEEVLDYQSYLESYPDSKTEMYKQVGEKIQHKGTIRRVSDLHTVEYAINLIQASYKIRQDIS